MRIRHTILFLLASFVLTISGCGGGSSGTGAVSDPLSTKGNTNQTTDNGSINNSANGFIMFTDKAGLEPGGQSNMLEPWEKKDVDPAVAASVAAMQLLPFKVTDSNGNPRAGVPVTLSVYSITTLDPDDVTIDFLVTPITEPNQHTITTDSAGMAIFM